MTKGGGRNGLDLVWLRQQLAEMGTDEPLHATKEPMPAPLRMADL